jgi:hypothetical protein
MARAVGAALVLSDLSGATGGPPHGLEPPASFSDDWFGVEPKLVNRCATGEVRIAFQSGSRSSGSI